ncbi:hypothetical protein [Yersinia intermedia]|uniref:hypothetical protein n=1 Tax=Yersinia intermedia TaxID=631 RepID=UPI0011A10293|nr:hypothetical protein [Yersinia intermedia]
MACKCFDEVSAKMKLHILERRGNNVAEVAESGFAHSALVFAEGDFCSVRLPYTFRFYKRKKNGELEQRLTNGDSSVSMNYCPFCGTKFEGKAATSQQ